TTLPRNARHAPRPQPRPPTTIGLSGRAVNVETWTVYWRTCRPGAASSHAAIVASSGGLAAGRGGLALDGSLREIGDARPAQLPGEADAEEPQPIPVRRAPACARRAQLCGGEHNSQGTAKERQEVAPLAHVADQRC